MISRREAFAALGAAPSAFAQRPYPGTAYRNYSRCLPDYLTALAAQAYRRRETEIALLTTPAAIRKRQNWVRETFWKLTGGEPERTPLNFQVRGEFRRDGYLVRKITYESQPGLVIPANLYIPDGTGPFPGALFQMGHSLNGKAAEPYQKCCQGLARLGYVVLAFDPMGQGERTYYPQPNGVLTRLGSADDEHTVPGRQMLLIGDTATRMQTWDAVRSLDVLATLPFVDPKRLAATGQSGGGTLTMFLAAVDDRLACAAVACGNTENHASRNFNSPGSTDDAEQNFIGGGQVGFDRWDVLYPIAPKPLLILASARDFFGTYSPNYLANGWEEYQKLERVYGVLGAPNKIAWADTPLPHGLAYALRMRIYNWFEKWLKGSAKVIDREPHVQPEKDETLWVGSSGNVVRDFGGTTPHRMIRSAATGKTGDWRRLLGIASVPTQRMLTLSRVQSEGLSAEAVEVRTAPNVYVPGWLFVPQNPKSVILLLDPAGRSARWPEGSLQQALAATGSAVCAADLRGIGDLRPEYGRGAVGHAASHASEENYAWASLMLGDSLLRQRATDILGLTAALRLRFPGQPLRIAAAGRLCVPALFATALDGGVGSAILSGGLVRYRSIVDTEEYTESLANFLPGILHVADLADIAAQCAPRKIILAGAVSADGKPVSEDSVRETYRSATNVEVRPSARWDAATLRFPA